jgi:hypothetical protein
MPRTHVRDRSGRRFIVDDILAKFGIEDSAQSGWMLAGKRDRLAGLEDNSVRDDLFALEGAFIDFGDDDQEDHGVSLRGLAL